MDRSHPKRFQPAKAETIRDINSALILNLLRNSQPISRAEAARRTGLQRSTISQIVDELLEKELVVETGAGKSSGGRKPTLMRLNAERFCVFGVSVGVKDVELAMSDLNGHLIYRETFIPRETPGELFGAIARKINQFVAARRKERLHYEGIGISVPGLVDYSTGEILFAPNLGWRHVQVEEFLGLQTPMPVYLDNDANAAALAESWYDTSKNPPSNMALVLVSDGIGVGLIINHEVYRGANGIAGEFGHSVVVAEGQPCGCGNAGCWERYASDHATLSRYFAKGSSRTRRGGRQKPANKAFPLTFTDLINRAHAGDRHAVEAITESARYVGIGLGNLLAGLNPEEIVMSGQITRAWDLIEMPMRAAIARNIQHNLTAAKIRPSRLGSDGPLLGAVVLAISRRFAIGRAARVSS